MKTKSFFIHFILILLINFLSSIQEQFVKEIEFDFQFNQSQILNASDGVVDNAFGTSVSISNNSNILLIGAPQANVESNYQQGKAYIFQRNENEWNQIQILNASDGQQNDGFGWSVSISNDSNILLIGAHQANYSQGKAYIFQNNGTNWNQSQILNASDGQQNDLFGYSVSISNDSKFLLIGAPQANYQQGKAYIFQKNGTNWNQSQILNASDGKAGNYFGYSVSISNDSNIILIGSPYATVGSNTYQGKVYIFQNNGTNWNQIQILIASDGQASDNFGTSVSITNDLNILLIGSSNAFVLNNTKQGKAYIFQKNGNEWNQIKIIIANDGKANDYFGTCIFSSENYSIISSLGSDSSKGKAYLFLKNLNFSTPTIPSTSSSNSKTGIIVSSTVVPIIVISAIILIIFLIRKKKPKKAPDPVIDEKELTKWMLKEDK